MKRNGLRLIAACWLPTFWISIAPAASVPLRITQGHILLDQVYIDDAGPFRFVLDTGAQSSSIRSDVAASIGLKPSYRVVSSSVGGERYLPAAVAKKVTLGNRSASPVELVIHDLDAMRLVDPRVQGVLGQNYLARFDYLLDLQGQTLSFEDSAGGERIPFSRSSERMMIRVGDLRLVLDSGAGDLVLFRNHRDLRKTRSVVQVAAVTGTPDVRLSLMPNLKVGERILRNIPAAVLPQADTGTDGLLPLTLFDTVYVNNTSGYVVVQ